MPVISVTVIDRGERMPPIPHWPQMVVAPWGFELLITISMHLAGRRNLSEEQTALQTVTNPSLRSSQEAWS